MSGTAWAKFFWSDWSGDRGLALCSLAAQGLWMRMLCVAAESNPIGYVAMNGRPLGVTDIARLAGVTETEANPLLDELDRNGVFSRDRRDCIYSRRMVREAKRAAVSRRNGKTGGNPTLLKHRENSPLDNHPLNDASNPQKPDTREIEEPSGSLSDPSDADPPPKDRLKKREAYSERFRQFWVQYPTDRLMSKKAAFQVWHRLDPESQEAAIRSLPAFRAYCAGHPDYRPVHPNRYLSQERFVGFLEAAEKIASTVFIVKGTPEWLAWQAVRKWPCTNGPDGKEGWWFPSRWPDQQQRTAA